MKLQSTRHSQKAVCLLIFFLFTLLFSCHKKDHWPPKATEESADVVHDWYKLLLRMQLHQNPPPFGLYNISNLGYVGVGLYENRYSLASKIQ